MEYFYETGYQYGNWVEGYDTCNVLYTTNEEEAMKHYLETQCNYLIRYYYMNYSQRVYEKYYKDIGWRKVPLDRSIR